MRVWIVNQYATTSSQPGSPRHYSLARSLVERGHKVRILASSFDHRTKRETLLQPGENSRLENHEGVEFLWVRTPEYRGNDNARVWNMLSFGIGAWMAGQSTDNVPDIIIGSSPHLFGALAAKMLALRYRLPFVLEVRDLWPQSLIDLGKVSPYHPMVLVLKLIEGYLYRSSNLILTPLPKGSDYISTHGAGSKKILWIPNGIDLRDVPEPKRKDFTRPFKIMYAGAISVANALDTLIDAFELLKSAGWEDLVELVVLGDGPEKGRLQRRVNTQQLRNITFIDLVPRSQVYEALGVADAFVIMTRRSALYRQGGISPNKLYDYMAVARPVIIATEAETNPVEEARAGITVPPENAQQLADALGEIAQTPADDLWQMGLRGRKHVEQHYDLGEMAAKLETELTALMTTQGGGK